MSIINERPATEIERDAGKVKSIVTKLVRDTSRALKECRDVVKGQKSELNTELGDDAAALLTVYSAYKAILESTEIGWTVADLPD